MSHRKDPDGMAFWLGAFFFEGCWRDIFQVSLTADMIEGPRTGWPTPKKLETCALDLRQSSRPRGSQLLGWLRWPPNFAEAMPSPNMTQLCLNHLLHLKQTSGTLHLGIQSAVNHDQSTHEWLLQWLLIQGLQASNSGIEKMWSQDEYNPNESNFNGVLMPMWISTGLTNRCWGDDICLCRPRLSEVHDLVSPATNMCICT